MAPLCRVLPECLSTGCLRGPERGCPFCVTSFRQPAIPSGVTAAVLRVGWRPRADHRTRRQRWHLRGSTTTTGTAFPRVTAAARHDRGRSRRHRRLRAVRLSDPGVLGRPTRVRRHRGRGGPHRGSSTSASSRRRSSSRRSTRPVKDPFTTAFGQLNQLLLDLEQASRAIAKNYRTRSAVPRPPSPTSTRRWPRPSRTTADVYAADGGSPTRWRPRRPSSPITRPERTGVPEPTCSTRSESGSWATSTLPSSRT